MAIFAKDGRPTETRAANGDAILSIVAGGMRVVGDLEGPGLIKIDGRVEGSISGARQVIVGRDGSVRGNINATEVILAGAVEGAVVATERAELQASAVVSGDIHTRTIVVHEGARINGTVRMSAAGIVEGSDERPAVQVMR